MKKRRVVLLLIISILIIVLINSVNFVSASWWNNFYGKITGQDTAAIEGGSVGGGSTEGGSSGGSSGGGSSSGGGGGGGSGPAACSEGETKKHTCPDGTQVDWCHCSGGNFICINSPENACPVKACTMPSCEGAYPTGEYDNGCPVYKCTPIAGCIDGDIKKYLCSDKHTEVDWCVCNTNGWICVNSPESKCPHSTCAMPVCSGTSYPTGAYDENDCPIYICPEGETCSPGIGEEIVCSDGTTVPRCKCSSQGKWVCPTDMAKCPPEPTCPEGCICKGNVMTCPVNPNTPTNTKTNVSAGGAVGSGISICPIGCTCTNQTITCTINNETENGCAMGCKLNDACVLPGIRTSINQTKKYCDVDSNWKEQKIAEENCDNNYECNTNLCIDSKCLSSGFWQKILEWFKNLFG